MKDRLFKDRLFYAVEAVLYVAYNSANNAVASKDIAASSSLSPRYLDVLMQKLAKAGILRGMRGSKGGYVLAKERRNISLADIYKALIDDLVIARNSAKSTLLGSLVVANALQKANKSLLAALSQISIYDLCEEAESRKIKKITEEKADFAI